MPMGMTVIIGILKKVVADDCTNISTVCMSKVDLPLVCRTCYEESLQSDHLCNLTWLFRMHEEWMMGTGVDTGHCLVNIKETLLCFNLISSTLGAYGWLPQTRIIIQWHFKKRKKRGGLLSECLWAGKHSCDIHFMSNFPELFIKLQINLLILSEMARFQREFMVKSYQSNHMTEVLLSMVCSPEHWRKSWPPKLTLTNYD